jgi:hypothetical protein
MKEDLDLIKPAIMRGMKRYWNRLEAATGLRGEYNFQFNGREYGIWEMPKFIKIWGQLIF